MKKFVIIIVILLIIFIGMFINRNFAKKENLISIQEVEEIEQCISECELGQGAGTLFVLNKIEKNEEQYTAEIVVYVLDYSLMLKEEPENVIIIRDENGKEILRYDSSSQEDEMEIVKRNIDKFEKKKIELNKIDGRIYIKKEQ